MGAPTGTLQGSYILYVVLGDSGKWPVQGCVSESFLDAIYIKSVNVCINGLTFTYVLLYCVSCVWVHICCFKCSMAGAYRMQISQHRWAITNHSHSNMATHTRPAVPPLGPAMSCSWIMSTWEYANTNFFIKSFVLSQHGMRPRSKTQHQLNSKYKPRSDAHWWMSERK